MPRLVVVADRDTAEAAGRALRDAGFDAEIYVPEGEGPIDGEAAVAAYRETMQRLAATGTLAAGAVHDMSNVLTALTAYADDPGPAAMRMLRAGLTRLRGIASSLMAFARPDDTYEVVFDLTEIAHEAAALANPVVRQRARIDVAAAPSCFVCGRPGQLSQVLVNLLLNASQAIEPEHGTIRVETAIEGDQVVARVRDNGRGMSTADVEHAFEAFVTSRSAGVGLGLYVSSHIVHGHGGVITIDSEPGEGTTVSIYLPRALASTPAPDDE